MAIAGVRPSNKLGKGYLNDPIAKFAAAFKNVTENILTESSIDIYQEPQRALRNTESLEALREFFVNESYDPASMTAEQAEEFVNEMNELFTNDREAILESTSINTYNPVIGMSFPFHKNILMNCVFEGVIPRTVAVSPKFTRTMETRKLIGPDGTEIDIWKEQNKIKEIIDSTVPVTDAEFTLPEVGDTDALAALGLTAKDNIDIDVAVTKIFVNYRTTIDPANPANDVYAPDPVELPVRYKLDPGYGDYDRMLVKQISIPIDQLPAGSAETDPIVDTLTVIMRKNTFEMTSIRGKVAKLTLSGRRDTSDGLTKTAQVRWEAKTSIVEIPTAKNPLNTTISPEEMKDIKALYNIDQLAKIMSMYKDVMGNHKDDTIRAFLDESMTRLPDSQKIERKFDFAPRDNYAHDHITWRHLTFFDAIDTYVTQLLTVLNDTNMTVTFVGRSDIIRKILPTEYSYQTPQNIGPVELEFQRTVFTSNNRLYQFVSSQKLNYTERPNDIIILLQPRNSSRVIYMLYDYQFYVSNEIRNADNFALPSIHTFDRYLMDEYQPVQGRVEVLNPSGLQDVVDNIFPGGTGAGTGITVGHHGK